MLRSIHANFRVSITALVILALSSWQTIKAFGLLYPEIGSGRTSQFAPLKLQKSLILNSFSIENPGCLGYLEGNYERTIEIATFSLKGELFLSLGDKSIPTKIDLESSFNVLGQLVASVLKISNLESNTTIGLLNVDPIDITLLTSANGGIGKRKKFSVPGPILLNDLGTQFQLEYPAANKNIPLTLDLAPLEQLLNIKLNSSNDAKTKCIAAPRMSLDLLKSLTKIRGKLSTLLPQIPLGVISEFSGPSASL